MTAVRETGGRKGGPASGARRAGHRCGTVRPGDAGPMAWVEEPPLRDAGAVADVVRRIRAVGAGVPARDGVAVFTARGG